MKKLPRISDTFHHKGTVIFSEFINALMYVLLVVASGGVVVGIFQAGKDLITGLQDQSTSNLLETFIVDLILVIAIIEVIRSIIRYLKDGKVEVSLIIDTVVVVMLNEIVRDYFENGAGSNLIYLTIVVAVLMVLRLIADENFDRRLISKITKK